MLRATRLTELTGLRSFCLMLSCLVLAACTSTPPVGMRDAQFVPSPNFDMRRPDLVILHHTGDPSLEGTLRTLTSTARKVSAHYLIGRDGRILQLVDERNRAWHAGVAWWGGRTDINSASIGIELVNSGHEPYSDAQIAALLTLLGDLRERYRIPVANYLGHGDVAPGRKVDPSAWFPWRTLAEHGFGLWCDPESLLPAPAGFDLPTALTALGYDPARPEASRAAFLLHFARAASLDSRQQAALAACLLRQREQAQGLDNWQQPDRDAAQP